MISQELTQLYLIRCLANQQQGLGLLQKQAVDKLAPASNFFAFMENHTKKRSDKNNATFAMGGFAGVIDEAILQPIGVELRGDNEHLIWSQFTCVPTKSY